jgi:membrane protease YdiL (CAAX protease family)
LWCLLFLFITQVPGAITVGLIVVVLALLSPDTLPLETLHKPDDLLKSAPMSAVLGVAFFFTELIVIGFSWLVIRLVVGRDWTRQLALRRPGLGQTLLTLASFPALVLLGNVVYEVLRNFLHLPSVADLGVPGMEQMVGVFSRWPAAFAVLVIGVGPGIGEELWCRGFLGRGLVGNYGVVCGVLATSFFFGFIHMDPCQGTMAMVMGLWLHFVYLTTRSLWLPMLLHFLNNSFSVLAPRFPLLQMLDAPPNKIPVLVYVSALLVLIAVSYALYQSRARLAATLPKQLLLWQPAFEGVEYPPEGSGVRVVHPLPSPLAAALAIGGFVLFVLACAAWIAPR